MPKLLAALDVYRGLAGIAATRGAVLNKVLGMLMHPFPKIRGAAAETLWVVTGEERVKGVDLSMAGKSVKGVVEELRVVVGG